MSMPRRTRSAALLAALVLAGCTAADAAPSPATSAATPSATPSSAADSTPPRALPNDNRTPAGRLAAGVRLARLEVRLATWYPGGPDGPATRAPAFAEEGAAPTIPGPLLRVTSGATVQVIVRNALDRPIAVHGLGRTRGVGGDSLVIAPGDSATARFVAGAPGLHYYLARPIPLYLPGTQLDGTAHGALVVDPSGHVPADRIFVISGAGYVDTTTVSGLTRDAILTLNGVEWPHTERFDVTQGDTLRWRWINLTDLDHPMHLHGFHFRVDARGDGRRDTLYAPAQRWHAVTEHVAPGHTLATTWVPERPGNWIFHCHLASHVTPIALLNTPYADRAAAHAAHAAHGASGGHQMAGLVLGIRVRAPEPPAADERRARALRLIVRSRPRVHGEHTGYAYVLGGSPEERDTTAMPAAGPTLVLRRGQPVAVTIVNRSHEPAAVHWHGIELESYPDGVPGLSGDGDRLLPAIAPGDSLTVRFTPPRAGTFMYHSHFNEMQQIASGLNGAIVVLEPGARWNPARDHVVVIGDAHPFLNFLRDPAQPIRVNGHLEPPPLELRAGVTHRLRLINIRTEFEARVALLQGDTPVQWRPVAKDGATLPAALATPRAAALRFFPGEIHDVEVTPAAAGELTLRVWRQGDTMAETRVPVRVTGGA